MTEKEMTQDAPLAIEAGTMLKNKRESLGLSQEEIAKRLRLRVAVIEEIENNQFDAQQVATFTRGYIKSYAKYVGIEEHVILAALETEQQVQHQEQEMQSYSRKTNAEKHHSRIMLLTWVIAFVIVGISGVWWWQNQQADSLTPSFTEAAPLEQEAEVEAPQVETLSPEIAEPVISSAENTIESVESDEVIAEEASVVEEVVTAEVVEPTPV